MNVAAKKFMFLSSDTAQRVRTLSYTLKADYIFNEDNDILLLAPFYVSTM